MSSHEGLIVSVSGIRGIIGESLYPVDATRFAAALGTFLGGGTVVVSRDSRPSGQMLRHAVFAGLLSVGCRIEDVGICSTPTCGLAVRHFSAAGGIQITASHNPSPWNGLKMFGADGSVLSAEQGAEVRAIFESGEFRRTRWDQLGEVRVPLDPSEIHAETVLALTNVTLAHMARARVLLDANGGAGGPLGVRLLEALGCEIIEVSCQQDGYFVHEAEPIPAHLQDIAPMVPRVEAQVGFVLDPDADRLALIDETGRCLSEEMTLALAVQYRLTQSPGTVVINMSTSRMVEDVAAAAGVACIRSAVGEANVVAKMRELDAIIGGEGNGGVIDPRVGWVRDPYIGMALILQHMAANAQSLSKLADALPQYHMLKGKCTIDRTKLPAAMDRLTAYFSGATINRIDGLRLDLMGSHQWMHIRSSNTEPIVRIIVEAPDAAAAEELMRQTVAIVTEQ